MMYELLIPFYDIGLIVASFFYIVKYAWRRRINRTLFQRIFLPAKVREELLRAKDPIWIHAVSVGEVNSLKGLLERLLAAYPGTPLVLSVVTPQGKALADKLYKDKAKVFYLPLDISLIIKKTIKLIGPRIFLCLETEIWPNLYFFLERANVPIVIFNARLSDKSLPLYRLVRPFVRPVLRRVACIACQDSLARQRFLGLGVDEVRCRVTGNMKFKSINPSQDKLKAYLQIGERIKTGGLLIVAGSTHSPEEEQILEVYKDIVRRHADAQLIICPRHVERAAGILKSVERSGFRGVATSKIDDYQKEEKSVFVVDTTGDLIYFYSIADLVFVGGSLARYGGHNILEPAYFSKPIIFGRFMFNFRDIAAAFLNANAAWQVNDTAGLEEALLTLIADEALRAAMGREARRVLDQSQDSVEENLAIAKNFL